jgi:AcrR family transcriptional regulator
MTRKKVQTADKILDTAHGLFMERGYVGVSINDVVRAVGITKPSLYYHYADKQALYAAVAERALRQMGAELIAATSAPELPFAAQLTRVIETIQAHNAEDFRMMRHELRVHLDAGHQERVGRQFYAAMMAPIEALMARGIAQGICPDQQPSELAMLFFCIVEAFTGPEAMAVQLRISAQQITDMFLHGVARATTVAHG